MADPRPRPPWTTRLVAAALEAVTRRTEGYDAPMILEVLRTHGWSAMTGTMGKLGTVANDLETALGPIDGQLVMAFAAFWEGCGFCSRGHLLASNVLRHHQEGTLFPLVVDDVLALQALPDEAAWAEIRGRLVEFPRARALLERQFALRAELVEPTTEEDAVLMASIHAWGWLTDCTIVLSPELPVEPLSRAVAKHPAWTEAYRRAVGPVPV